VDGVVVWRDTIDDDYDQTYDAQPSTGHPIGTDEPLVGTLWEASLNLDDGVVITRARRVETYASGVLGNGAIWKPAVVVVDEGHFCGVLIHDCEKTPERVLKALEQGLGGAS